MFSHPCDVSVIACAYNEAQNLPRFLDAVLSQTGPSFRLREVLCVASGCTDGTDGSLGERAARDPRIRPVIESARGGKASALSLGLGLARGDTIVLANADTLPMPGAFEALISPFRDPRVGLACARLLPANAGPGFTAELAMFLWELHDSVSRALPKSTGAVVFRAGPVDLPRDIEDDDTYLGILIGRTRGRSVYARRSVFLHRVPETPADFLGQRWRINRQIVGLRRRTGMVSSTWRPGLMARCLVRFVRGRPDRALPLLLLAGIEGSVRLAALASRLLSRRPLTVWAPLRTTKSAIDPAVARE